MRAVHGRQVGSVHSNSQTIQSISAVSAYLPANLVGAVPERVCERMAKGHYENFTVGSILLPRQLRKHVYNIYAYCRACDDLADETGDTDLSLRLLSWWRQELYDLFRGRPHHPVFQALAETVSEFQLPIQPFDDLVSAFEQDQRVTRYETFDDLLGYCKRSANPVGRLFLCLLGYTDSRRRQLSDCTCTALQLANFWQDIAIDRNKGRIYIPREDMDRFGYTEEELANGVHNPSFVRLMRFEVERTRRLFDRGAALEGLVSGVGAADISLFTAGGLALLRSLERHNYNIFHRRITVPKLKKSALVASWVARHLLSRARWEGSA